MKLTINGRIASLKNHRIPIKSGGRIFLIPSSAWKEFEKDAIKQLQNQLATFSEEDRLYILDNPPYKVSMTLYVKSGGRRSDADGMAAGVFEVLQKSGVIKNDYYIDDFHVTRLYGVLGDEYRADVEILPIMEN